MPILQDISFHKKANRRKSMLILSDDEEEEDYDTAVLNTRKNVILEESFENDEDDEGYLSPLKAGKENVIPKRKGDKSSSVKATSNPSKARKRRRSSARFLRLSGRFSNGDRNAGDEVDEEENKEDLAEVYSKAIRLNAENKINSANAWDLQLVENMDKLLGDDDDATEESGEYKDVPLVKNLKDEKRVNFTKASCTLDASVKIYSYRVDDVHLTSYKFLANLNRTDNGKDSKDDHVLDRNSDIEDGDFDEALINKKKSYLTRDGKTSTVKTIETNVGTFRTVFCVCSTFEYSCSPLIYILTITAANLNISKLESAYDIDPIFHRMSQKFDEGGAKGLLLNNLGVANDGCRIVLDSKEEPTEEPQLTDEEVVEMSDEKALYQEKMIDLTSIMEKFGESLSIYSLDCMQFVPQLEDLRQRYEALEAEGFVDATKIIKKPKSNRYANDEDEEAAAEESIHREALERSTANPGGTSFLLGNTSVANAYKDDDDDCDDNGVGFEIHDDGNDDDNFDNFLAMDTHADKYSSDSFRNSCTEDEFSSLDNTSQNKKASTLLDELCDGDLLTQGTQFTYFNPKAIEGISSGNQWAGSAHWKKRVDKAKLTKKSTNSEPKRKDHKRKKKHVQTTSVINLYAPDDCIKSLLKSKPNKGRKTKADPTQLTNAMVLKYNKERNVLPYDAEIDLNQFTDLFMRPGSNLLNKGASTESQVKNVDFEAFDTKQYYDDNADDNYDDGPGFDLHENIDGEDEFVIKELEGIRKIGKIEIGHAHVAKKVDVKRLKSDLWIELYEKTAPDEMKSISSEDCLLSSSVEDSTLSTVPTPALEKVVSFKETVEKLGSTEAQEDVSLAFYFICVLHLANEKGLKLENGDHGLQDFIISRDKDVLSTD